MSIIGNRIGPTIDSGDLIGDSITIGGGGPAIQIDQLDVSAAGTYSAPSGRAYDPVVVPAGTEGTPTVSKGAVQNHSVDVTPSVTNVAGYIAGGAYTGTPISVLASELVSGTKQITQSGTGIDVTDYAAVDVPAGTEGTPTASKGAVQNHSVDVTPSVTNTAGYISGGTHTGTAVTVAASELVSGTKSITANGTNIDVTEYAAVDVNVPASGVTPTPLTVSNSGTYNAPTGYAYDPVTVPAAGTPSVTVTKGAVVNHAITVSSAYSESQAGWIPVSSGAGGNATVSASELVSGTKSITQNGVADVTEYASVDVNVPIGAEASSGTITITSDTRSLYITHGLSQKPNFFAIYTVDTTTPGASSSPGFRSIIAGIAGYATPDNGYEFMPDGHFTGAGRGYNSSGVEDMLTIDSISIDDTEIFVDMITVGNYYFKAGKTYTWRAVV